MRLKLSKHILLFLYALFFTSNSALAIEEPDYVIRLKESNLEVREYPALLAAEVAVSGTRDQALNKGFSLLADFIFGNNTQSAKISMTSPVTQSKQNSEKMAMTAPVIQQKVGDIWVIRFIMPKKYTLTNLPRPNNPNVKIVTLKASSQAVIRYSGLARDNDIKREEQKLRAFIEKHNFKVKGPLISSLYDPPWTPRFARRNELALSID